MRDVTVIIPAKDEAGTIGEVVTRSRRWATDVLVVDGRSTDDSVATARAAGARVLSDHGRGKGDAIRVGISEIRTGIAVFLDADGSHDADDIPALVAPIERGEADHVLASRLIGGSSELHGGFDEFFRLAGSAFITACVNWRFGVRLSDSQNGFRAIRTELLRSLRLRENGTTIEQEILIQSLASGARVLEVPSHEYRRRFGNSHIQVSRVWPRYGLSLAANLFIRCPLRARTGRKQLAAGHRAASFTDALRPTIADARTTPGRSE